MGQETRKTVDSVMCSSLLVVVLVSVVIATFVGVYLKHRGDFKGTGTTIPANTTMVQGTQR